MSLVAFQKNQTSYLDQHGTSAHQHRFIWSERGCLSPLSDVIAVLFFSLKKKSMSQSYATKSKEMGGKK